MAAKRTNASLDGWFTVKQKSSKKSLVELACETDYGDKVTRERTVPAVEIVDESSQPDTERSTTELCLLNNADTTTFQDCRSYELDTMVLQENEHSISDLEDDWLSYSADKECSSNEGSITAGSGTQPNQTPITDCQEVPGPSTISLLDNETPAAECQELCCSISQSGPF